MRCFAVLLKADGMPATKVGERVDMEQHTVMENTDKLIRQYIPKTTVSSTISEEYIIYV